MSETPTLPAAHRSPTFHSLCRGARNVELGRIFRLYPQPLLTFAISAAVSFASAALPALRIEGIQARVQQAVRDRAAVALHEDFRGGLENWIGRGQAIASSWSFDAAGFVHPGRLALYRPSLGLADYQMQFLGTIDKKALSWVVRAADFDNYYVVQLTVLKPGPLPVIGITRYAVIDGKAQNAVMTPLVMSARSDTLYRVRLDIRDDNFVLAVQDRLVDTWSEPRLRRGGIGFFSEENVNSSVTGVQVKAGYDVLGRLVAYFF